MTKEPMNKFDLLDTIEFKCSELSGRSRCFRDILKAKPEGDCDFIFAMLGQSVSAINFWFEALGKACEQTKDGSAGVAK